MLAFPRWPSSLPGYNLTSHWLAYQIVWQAFRPTINRWRREALGLGRAPFWGRFGETRREVPRQEVPVLNGFSGHVVPRPPDWGDRVQVTGYWFPEEEEWQPPADLVRFLEGGPPPVFVGFGSMPVPDAEGTTALVLEALRRSGQRGIVHAGWGGVGSRDLPEWAFRLEYAPYGWLFPRMAAVVHHGGSGTTAFGLRAGVPSLVVPFVFDQFYWGRRIAELGVGPAPVPFGKLTAEGLAAAIDEAVSDGEMQQRARGLGERIRAEDGLGAAVKVLEECLHRHAVDGHVQVGNP
jgi:UDP:flavonoid glycosyltransferase YjiC (YdhE family)